MPTLICELPHTDADIRQWCRDIFLEKDASLELHQSENSFGDMECHGIGRPKKSLYVVVATTYQWVPVHLNVPPSQLYYRHPRKSRRKATTRPNNATENGHEAKSNIHVVPLSQHMDSGIRSTTMGNGNPGESSKVEKEEGVMTSLVYDGDDEESDDVLGGGSKEEEEECKP
ncbi:unnamed protein product [Lactuca saligna]|uniref:Acyltransferase C-terminal domain-containing protein n=1 Tax=Lactuca saligna TaxID=75948 RepID=A0AA35YAU4_LACSI|nr:unnamed protein product [Lactuca saligna]